MTFGDPSQPKESCDSGSLSVNVCQPGLSYSKGLGRQCDVEIRSFFWQILCSTLSCPDVSYF